MQVRLVQVCYVDAEPVADRVERVVDLVRAQRGADLVVLPELWAPGGFAYREWPARAEPVDGPVAVAMAAAAREAGVVLHAGSIIERGADRDSGGRELWNTSLVFGTDGGLLAAYRKIHRFGFGQGEPRLLRAGDDPHVLVDLPGGWRAALSTCYDLRFPELYRSQLDDGAQLFLVPAAWPVARLPHWRLFARARAVENQCVVLACNTAGRHADTTMGGHSMVVAADGTILAEAGEDEQVLGADIDLSQVAAYRRAFPVLADRRLAAPDRVDQPAATRA